MRSGLIVAVVVAGHLIALFTISVTTASRESREDTSIFKVVDAQELPPPEPEREPEPPEPEPPEPEEQLPPQESVTEEVEESDEPIEEPAPRPEPTSVTRPAEAPIEYLPQHRISVPPGIPTDEIRSRIEYPSLARMQGIEGVVYLELFVDATGKIRRIEILRDPGYGMGAAAQAAFEGIRATPARANDEAVAVRYRYPIRFQLR